MKDLRFKDGDLVLTKDDFSMVSGIDEVGQCIESTLGTNLGEFVLDQDLGIEYLNMLGKGVTDEDIQAEVFAGLSQEERIETVTGIIVTRDEQNRKASARFTAIAESGETIESEVDLNVG